MPANLPHMRPPSSVLLLPPLSTNNTSAFKRPRATRNLPSAPVNGPLVGYNSPQTKTLSAIIYLAYYFMLHCPTRVWLTLLYAPCTILPGSFLSKNAHSTVGPLACTSVTCKHQLLSVGRGCLGAGTTSLTSTQDTNTARKYCQTVPIVSGFTLNLQLLLRLTCRSTTIMGYTVVSCSTMGDQMWVYEA